MSKQSKNAYYTITIVITYLTYISTYSQLNPGLHKPIELTYNHINLRNKNSIKFKFTLNKLKSLTYKQVIGVIFPENSIITYQDSPCHLTSNNFSNTLTL